MRTFGELALPDAAATSDLGMRLALQLRPGDLVTLSGPIGAGKSHLIRATIQTLLAAEGRSEDVPSPSFTLVQGYETRLGEVLHVDLYRLGDPRDLDDIGLTDALGRSVCLIEWPQLLGLPPRTPRLGIDLSVAGDGRRAALTAIGPRWAGALADLLGEAGQMPHSRPDP